ncbi:Planctomycete cytochrome C [Roseimaritima multifibrata]|uniref:Planctomycete cytochrome C n=1 Tax=Roseimaritima multifibrata TaxID=1930274 RepID=A0A517MKI0_9BACT|nr:DUF1553 domain-containing protein [Roseimaritima multifibrata]QDS95350.1 Planctomycete cytochrome C [Roseimaritima multifibrata]
MRILPLLTCWAFFAWSVFVASAVVADQPKRVDFNTVVRPILSENCFHCHGPDEEARGGDLRLDVEADAKDYAIVEGDLEASELITRILATDPEDRMPPVDSERSLSNEEIEALKQWVAEGAEYQGHWSFSPPVRPELPLPERSDLQPIDRFVQAKLRDEGISPAPPADRETLLRRITFDITGLPPTLAEMDAFLSDASPDAVERLVDRLLSDKAFGERMAAEWLDAARYSDTYGYQVDRDRFVWPWRDWVIESFNRNLPYDQFITEQLAGDLLPDASRDQILATTFSRLHPQKVEGGSVPEEFRAEYIADRVQTVATAVMGLTYECCRCHSHKYDPISHAEYYQLTAFFDNIDEAGLYSFFTPSVPTPTLTLPTDKQQAELDKAATKLKNVSAEWDKTLKTQAKVWEKRFAESKDLQALLDTSYADKPLLLQPTLVLECDESPPAKNSLVDGVFGKAFQLTGDDAVGTSVGNFKRSQPFAIAAWIQTPDVKERAVIFHRSRAWTDAASRGYELLIEEGRLKWSLIHFWPGNAISLQAVQPLPVGEWVHVAVTYDGSSRAAGLQIFMNGKPVESEVVRDRLQKNITGGGGDNIAIGERFRDRGFKGGMVDRFQVFDGQLTELEVQRLADSQPNDLAQFTRDLDTTSEAVKAHLLHRLDPVVGEQREKLRQARETYCNLENSLQEIMVMRELDPPRPSFIRIRGEYAQIGEEVHPGTPAALPPFPEAAPRNRLGLTQWLFETKPLHPLTSRVAVNRLWQIVFGVGLVRTPEDFGNQGQPPTHPELLDWLAVDFAENGWDTKRMLKQIFLSQTYQQASSHPDSKLAQQDPENRLLARFPSYRLPAEMLRDNALAISGRLVDKIGGPPVKPYEIEASFKPSGRDKGAGLYRRSLYTYWKRTGPAPAMMTLDAAARDVCRVQRERTSSPLQAFVILNGPQYVEAARGLAEQIVGEYAELSSSGEEESKPAMVNQKLADAGVRKAFRITTSRHPSEAQAALLSRLFESQLEYFTEDPKRTSEYLAIGDAPVNADLDASSVAAMTVVVSTLMNFDLSMVKR